MDEGMKNKIILALGILTIIFLIGSVSSCISSCKQKKELTSEKVMRMDLEEKTSKYAQDKAGLENKIKELDQLIKDEKAEHEITKKALSQEQMINESMKKELEKITKLKETLENDLKEALVNVPKKTSK